MKPILMINMDKHIPIVGDSVKPDEWRTFEILEPSDGFSDSSFPGCQFRLPCRDMKLAVNIIVTGKPHFLGRYPRNDTYTSRYKSRCRIEFVGDGEPSVFSGGWIFHSDNQ